ncbi:MAG: serine/threonine protein kinase [Elusimicrobia bacterium]|nr:serine/threonine protein kinase [Elusimicrobiota bacterium]
MNRTIDLILLTLGCLSIGAGTYVIAADSPLLEGIGGMGVVFKGWDRELERDVAIKRMHGAIAKDAKARDQFLREARTVAKLNHPYIVAIHDIVRSADDLYLVFEHVDGETISDILVSSKKLEPKECVRILRFVCEALAHAHENGVIHRDLKPANIMMSRRGYVKVMDFGIARHLSAGHKLGEGTIAGTLPYMAPEQHDGKSSAQSDVYSLGVVAYEFLMGERPFSGVHCHRDKEAERFPPLSKNLPEGLSRLVIACLKKDPAARPQGMSRVMAGLVAAR